VTRKIKQLEVKGARAQCPIAGDANVLMPRISSQSSAQQKMYKYATSG